MALTQRIEFRQTQSLVMTPQLMQAIKLLQLSNLDLGTFVEEELERNPLLERAAEDGSPLEAPQSSSEEYAEHSQGATEGPDGDFGGPDGDGGFEAGASGTGEDWIADSLGSRTEMEQTFDTGLENVFSEEPGEAAERAAQDASPST